MTDNFQQTVDLKEEMERAKNTRKLRREKKQQEQQKPKPKPKAEAIDQVYNEEHEPSPAGKDLHKISRPLPSRSNESAIRGIIIFLAFVIVATSVYFIFFRAQDPSGEVAGVADTGLKWYAIKLVNDEVYYGQITNTTEDPIIIKNVYYNYDQLNEGQETSDAGSLRLVKRGKETHGPDGTMNIIRTQVIYMEPLKEDSKVLRAILDYEQ